jgi:phosphatidylserine/phosphatidylglycerophosphate/cardiolipin synthase-like enzyme
MKHTNNDIFGDQRSERVGDNAFHLSARALLIPAIVLSLATFSACGASDVKEKRADEPATNAVVNIAFDADCEKMLIEEINRADKEILVAIYNITRKNITSALAHAVRRGVKVRLKYESKSHSDSEKMNDAIDYLEGKGVECTPIRMPDKEGIMHDKFTVIDRKRVLTGSFNYTSSASTVNYENLVLIESPAVAKRYIEEFEKIKSKQ